MNRYKRYRQVLNGNIPNLAFLCLVFLTLTSCAGNKLWLNTPEPAVEPGRTETPLYSIYAVGDAGEDNAQSRAVLSQLSYQATDDEHPGMVIFLGDNIYPAGLAPVSDAAGHAYGASLLDQQIRALDGYSGQILFIPGNHDWNEFKPGGLDAIRRQGQFLHDRNDPRVRMLPENGCGGPVLLHLEDKTVMIILDSQWWIQRWKNEPGINADCEFRSREEVKTELHRMIRDNNGKQILIAMHHPLMTQGHHGGRFTFRDHMFPLTKVVKWLWVPLPVIGSIYPGYRSWIGHPQDLRHPRYRSLKEAVLQDLEYDGELIFLSGHDHNLQYLVDKGLHFLLSGAGAKRNDVANDKMLTYGHKAAGFMQLDFYENNFVQLSVYEVDIEVNSSKIVFRKAIIQ